jgi:hypothetical protein
MKSFSQFVEQKQEKPNKDWRKEYVNLPSGFVPPKNMAPIIQAFLDSGSIELTKDTSSSVTLPKKSLFLSGPAVSSFLSNPSKRPKTHDLVTNATPEQVALILHSAGFKVPAKANKQTGKMEPDYDRSGTVDAADKRKAKEMDLSFKPELAMSGDNKLWFIKERGGKSSGARAIGVSIGGEVFVITTFRNGSEDEFSDNPVDDSGRNEMTMDSMYIELTKAEGENKKLYDPTRKGYHDVFSGTVRTVGKAEDRFGEDRSRVMKAIRLHCKFGKSKSMDKEIESAIPKFADLDGVPMDKVKEEFLEGLEDPDVDPKKYISLYRKFGLLSKVFPGVEVRTEIPPQLRDKKDKFVALAWMLQDNPVDVVNSALGDAWSNHERSMISYLISLREFSPDNLDTFLSGRKNLGVTKDHIKKWTDMFDMPDGSSARPTWSKRMRRFADFEPDYRKLVRWQGEDGEVHPEILSRNMQDLPHPMRSAALREINKKRLMDDFEGNA